MKKYLIVFFILTLIATKSFAWMGAIGVGGSVPAAGGGPSEVFSDDFAADATGWTVIEGSWSYDGVNQEYQCDTGFGRHGAYYATTELTTVNGWAKVELVDGVSGIAFRVAGATGNYYALNEYYGNQNLILYVHDENGSVEEIEEKGASLGIASGEYMCITWTGTGDDLVVRAWANCSNALPDSVSSWDSGAADLTFSSLTITNEANTGKYVGVTANAQHSFDNYTAGDLE